MLQHRENGKGLENTAHDIVPVPVGVAEMVTLPHSEWMGTTLFNSIVRAFHDNTSLSYVGGGRDEGTGKKLIERLLKGKRGTRGEVVSTHQLSRNFIT